MTADLPDVPEAARRGIIDTLRAVAFHDVDNQADAVIAKLIEQGWTPPGEDAR